MSNLNTIGVSFSSNTKDIVEQLESEMQSFGIYVHRYDKEIYARDDILEYMNFLINLNVVVLIIDDSYFESLFCLYELANLIDMPEKLLIVYKGDNFESLNLKVKEFKSVHEQLQDNTAMKWLTAELSKYNFDEIFNKVNDLFRKKYLTPEGLFNNQGKKHILQMLHFTPTLYLEKLNLILCRKTFMEREEGFEDYLEYGMVAGSGIRQYGNFARVEAYTKENGIFKGWYKGDMLVSKNTVYRFAVLENTELIAKFEKDKDPENKTNVT